MRVFGANGVAKALTDRIDCVAPPLSSVSLSRNGSVGVPVTVAQGPITPLFASTARIRTRYSCPFVSPVTVCAVPVPVCSASTHPVATLPDRAASAATVAEVV